MLTVACCRECPVWGRPNAARSGWRELGWREQRQVSARKRTCKILMQSQSGVGSHGNNRNTGTGKTEGAFTAARAFFLLVFRALLGIRLTGRCPLLPETQPSEHDSGAVPLNPLKSPEAAKPDPKPALLPRSIHRCWSRVLTCRGSPLLIFLVLPAAVHHYRPIILSTPIIRPI